MRISKIAQGEKVPAVKPDDLSSIPRTNMIEGVKQLQQRMCPEWFAYIYPCAVDECLMYYVGVKRGY